MFLSKILFALYLLFTSCAIGDLLDISSNSSSTTGGFINSTTGVATTGISTTGIAPTSSNCSAHLDCGSCTKALSCVWCPSPNGTTGFCENGYWYGPQTQSMCANWRWKQCFIAGKYALYGGLGVLGVILLCVCGGICCCCLCCRNKKKIRTPTPDSTPFQEEQQPFISKTPRTDSKREEMKKKYPGLRKDNTINEGPKEVSELS